MNIFQSILLFLFIAVQVYTLFLSYYYNGISIFGIPSEKEEPDAKPEKRFAIAVAAHNEEKVIKQAVDNLSSLDYPKELYDVYVICDNCNDNTAKIVRENGAIAMERFDETKRGKGYAINWFLDKLFAANNKTYDAVAIFDADNLASKNFLKKMNNNLLKGHRVIQGYLDSKNPDDTWITLSYSLAYWTMNRMFQLARKRLKLYSALGGTGFVVDTELLKEVGWDATSLTEDLEFTMKCLLRGIKPVWEHNAKVFDEKPLSFKASWNQRIRWLQGHWDCCFRYSGPLLKRAFTKFDFCCFDGFIYMIQPSRIIANGFIMLMAFMKYFFNDIYVIKMSLPLWLWVLGIFFGYGLPVYVLIKEKVSFRRMLGLIVYPFYGLTWIPISVIGLFKKNQKEWVHTIHTRNVEIHELDSASQPKNK